MAQEKPSLGQAIDQTIQALNPLDESTRKTVLIAVCTHLNIDMHGATTANTSPASSEPGKPTVPVASSPVPPAPRRHVDIRTFKEQKRPSSAKQMACLVAYYLQEMAPENESKESVTTADLEKYFKQAGFKLPQKIAQILPDAKISGYFDSVVRGEYKLNAVGYNLVAHNLPADGASA